MVRHAKQQQPPEEPPGGPATLVDLLQALSLAADLALGLHPEHAVRACYLGLRIAERLGIDEEERSELFCAQLLMDAGCTAWTSYQAAFFGADEIVARRALFFHADPARLRDVAAWLRRYVASESPAPTRAARVADLAVRGRGFVREGFRNTCEVSVRFATRLGMGAGVQRAIAHAFERWDGKGMPDGLRGDAIPILSRIMHASALLEVHHQESGRPAARELAREWRGGAFDPEVVDTFLGLSEEDGVWEPLERGPVWETLLEVAPVAARRRLAREELALGASVAGDFADMKAGHTVGHSRRVAEHAARIARRLSLPPAQVEAIRLAGRMHDVGIVAVPSFVLQKPEQEWASAEQEAVRLHAYHGERILGRLPGFDEVSEIVASHHERLDGSGYHRGLRGDAIPVGARVVAAADELDGLIRGVPGREAIGVGDAVAALGRMAGSALDPAVVAALAEDVGVEVALEAPRDGRQWPAGLTKREVEVLRLAARGLTRRQVAAELVVSESTVRTHLEHIYAKIGVSTRAAATLFAAENDLLDQRATMPPLRPKIGRSSDARHAPVPDARTKKATPFPAGGSDGEQSAGGLDARHRRRGARGPQRRARRRADRPGRPGLRRRAGALERDGRPSPGGDRPLCRARGRRPLRRSRA